MSREARDCAWHRADTNGTIDFRSPKKFVAILCGLGVSRVLILYLPLTLFFPYFSPCLRAASLPWRASVVGFAFAFAFTFAFAFAFALAFAFTQRPKASL